ncbi:MAG: hypothetical protein OCD01_15670 [Fibrobacterales bacterium]
MNSEEMKHYINEVIDQTFGHKDEYQFVDRDAVKGLIIATVLKPSDLDEFNRHEALYTSLGKATAICKGWCENGARTIKNPIDTQKKLAQYIKQTYGLTQPTHYQKQH